MVVSWDVDNETHGFWAHSNDLNQRPKPIDDGERKGNHLLL